MTKNMARLLKKGKHVFPLCPPIANDGICSISFVPMEVISTHERNIYRPRSKDVNVVAGLPVSMDYNCVYDSI